MPLFMSHPSNEGTGNYSIAFRPGAANYLLNVGYLFRITENMEILPSVLLRINPVNATQLDVHGDVIFWKRFWLGVSARTNGQLSALFQVQVNPQF